MSQCISKTRQNSVRSTRIETTQRAGPKRRVEDALCAMLDSLAANCGLVPDSQTDGHVDGLVKWIDPITILLHTIDPRYKDEDHQNYTICQEAKTILESFRIKIVELQLA